MSSVLVVDDEEVAADTVVKMLFEMNGATCWTAGESTAALKIVAEHKPDLVLLDVQLNNSPMDGFGILREAKRLHPVAHVVMITGFPDEEKQAKAKQLGADDYPIKPIPPEKLLEFMKKLGGPKA
ncbi:MAG: response regulator [Candidatus Omnitrophica bacterium]|nr:response regulator [Candidatus Omnitrophota bacterium]